MNENVKQRVIDLLDIETRVNLGLPPRKLNTKSFEWMMPRPYYVYHKSTQKLFSFEYIGYTVSSPVSIHQIGEISIFNLYYREYLLHVYNACGCFYLQVIRTPWTTNLKVKCIGTEYEDENSQSASSASVDDVVW